ncbi:hypothetical protein ACFLU9_02475 [Chloroflexota bacterium]
MTRRFIQRLFPLLAVALLVPWPIAYAHSYNVNGAGQDADAVQVEVAGDSAKPSWTAFGGAIGGVTTPGELFYVDASGHPGDILITLHITNTNELIHHYRYLILKVGVYAQTGIEQWQEASAADGELVSDIYITLRNGQVSANLAGHMEYKVAIESGSFYRFTANADGGSLSPRFYLAVDQGY